MEDRAPSVISTKAEGRVEKSFRRSFLPVFLAVLLLDRLTKELSPLLPASGLPLIPGVLGLRYFQNSGAAFFSPPPVSNSPSVSSLKCTSGA